MHWPGHLTISPSRLDKKWEETTWFYPIRPSIILHPLFWVSGSPIKPVHPLCSPRTRTVPEFVDGRALLLRGRSRQESGCQTEERKPSQGLDQDPEEVVVRPPVQRLPQRRRKAGSGKGGRPHRAAGQCQKCHLLHLGSAVPKTVFHFMQSKVPPLAGH